MASLEELRVERLRKLQILEGHGMDPYPSISAREFSLAEVEENFDEFSKKENIILAGRVMALRGQGAILFLDINDGTGRLQGLLRSGDTPEDIFELFKETVDIGDFVELKGTLFVTKRGEKTIQVIDWKMLSKSIQPLPDKWHGISDEETRYRKRYLDILFDKELRELFEKKTKFWEVTRAFMKEKGFFEVETPTLELTTGGAEANPFKTYHKDFDLDVYLRISVGELWQKRLIVAGYDKTFEIGHIYRNEGSSPNHLQEFTNMEFYWAYANYEDGMLLTQELYQTIAEKVFGTTKFTTGEHTYDLSGEWARIDYQEEVLKQTGIDVLTANKEDMTAKLKELNVKYEGDNLERLTDTLWKYCRKNISGPAFLINHPKLVSPLAKSIKERPECTERFQIIIAGAEAGNGYSELNNPIEQRKRFEEQKKLLEAGDEEAMMSDWEFVEALEHGMPPTCGFGFGERLFAFMVNKPVREVQFFPLMKPKETNKLSAKELKQTQIAVAVINKGLNLEPWEEMNTMAHLNAAFGARKGKNLLTKDIITTEDNEQIKLNIRHAIMIKTAKSNKEILNLIKDAKKEGVIISEFTREMIETTNDKKVAEQTAIKKISDIEYLGVLIFGKRTIIEKLTEKFNLYN